VKRRETSREALFQNFESELFDDRIREHILRDPFYLAFRFVAAHAIEIQNEKFALPNVLDI
jgi:hypothetical protein